VVVILSAFFASAWELATKVRLGKITNALDLVSDFASCVELEGFELLSISADHAVRAGLLPGPHKDPFDRMLIAQAQAESMPVVSNDTIFDAYAVRRRFGRFTAGCRASYVSTTTF
jgi:PIN domain nuclease of toxin-antitoxin system